MAENLRSTVRKSVGFYKEREEKDLKRRGVSPTAAVSKSDELYEIEVGLDYFDNTLLLHGRGHRMLRPCPVRATCIKLIEMLIQLLTDKKR